MNNAISPAKNAEPAAVAFSPPPPPAALQSPPMAAAHTPPAAAPQNSSVSPDDGHGNMDSAATLVEEVEMNNIGESNF